MPPQISVKEAYLAVIELGKTVAKLEGWSTSTQASLDRLGLDEVRDRLARVETRLEQLEKQRSRRDDRAWAVLIALGSAVLGALASFVLLKIFR